MTSFFLPIFHNFSITFNDKIFSTCFSVIFHDCGNPDKSVGNYYQATLNNIKQDRAYDWFKHNPDRGCLTPACSCGEKKRKATTRQDKNRVEVDAIEVIGITWRHRVTNNVVKLNIQGLIGDYEPLLKTSCMSEETPMVRPCHKEAGCACT